MSTLKQGRDQLKTYFETGDRPTEEEFEDLIDSEINQKDDDIYATGGESASQIGIGTDTPGAKLHVEGKTFISSKAGGTPESGNTLEVNSPDRHAILVRTSANDVMNFVDNNPGQNPKAFTFTDNSGRGFRFYKAVPGSGTNGELIGFYPNGNVGVNMNDGEYAGARLQVRGTSNWESHDGILRVEGPAGGTKENLRFGIVEDSRTWIQSHLGPLYINAHGRDTIINPAGQSVGIGTETPQNKLHVHNGPDGNGANTGLRLSTNASDGRILVSDGAGNASWQEKTVVTSGLWQSVGNGNIENGNTGNVGIGENAPQQKLHVGGNIKLTGDIIGKDSGGTLSIFSAEDGGAYMHMKSMTGTGANQGGMAFVAREGADKTNGYAFLQMRENPDKPSEFQWPRCLTIDGNRDTYFWDNSIYLRNEGDQNHGISFFGGTSKRDENKRFSGQDIDGPVVYGHSGGALGVVKNGNNASRTENIALRWDHNKNVNFQGNVEVQGVKPIKILRFKIHRNNLNVSTRVSSSKYSAAIIGFNTNEVKVVQDGSSQEFFEVYMYKSGGRWMLRANIRNYSSNAEEWEVHVMFVHQGLVEVDEIVSQSNFDSGNYSYS